MRVPLPFSRNWPENHSHNLGKALGEGLVYSARLSLSLSLSPLYPFHLSIPFTSLPLSPFYPFHLSIPFTSLSLSPLYPFHLFIPFTSLSLSPLYSFHLSIPFIFLSLSPLSLSLSYLSLPLFISPSTFLSLSLLLSLFSL